MSNYLVIAEVGESLVQLIWAGVKGDEVGDHIDNKSEISLESPAALRQAQEVRLSVFLFRVIEDAHTKNYPPVPGNGGRLRKTPLTLDLHYMITPLFGEAKARHALLGKVMSIFYDRPVLRGADLAGSLGDSGEEVRLILNSVPLDELARVWEALQKSYQLSICYIARVALLDSAFEQFLAPVLSKGNHYGEPDAR